LDPQSGRLWLTTDPPSLTSADGKPDKTAKSCPAAGKSNHKIVKKQILPVYISVASVHHTVANRNCRGEIPLLNEQTKALCGQSGGLGPDSLFSMKRPSGWPA
jgi:hypothetical protein